MMRKRSAEAKGKDSLIDALILDEMQKMTSLIDSGGGGPQGQVTEGSTALDASAFVDTAAWANEMQPGGPPPPPRHMRTPRPSIPHKRDSSLNNPAPDVESLEQMLEPDRTGVHKNDKKTPWALIIIVLVLIAAGAAAVAMFVIKK
jgi:hypothetical protein